MILDLTKGICETAQYKAWKFPGGEIHVKIKGIIADYVNIKVNLTDSDAIIFLALIVDTVRKSNPKVELNLFIPYMPYQQADRDFGIDECFSLKTICNFINSMNFNKVIVFDPHSDVTPALLNSCTVMDNSSFIKDTLYHWMDQYQGKTYQKDLIILSPDAGAYKKIFSLCEKIGFKGQIECCAKSRNHETGEKTIIVPKFDENKDVLIIDDICLAGGTFLGIANQIKNKCYLAVSHGIFNNGIDHLLKRFEMIYTTDSRCDCGWMSDKIKIYIL